MSASLWNLVAFGSGFVSQSIFNRAFILLRWFRSLWTAAWRLQSAALCRRPQEIQCLRTLASPLEAISVGCGLRGLSLLVQCVAQCAIGWAVSTGCGVFSHMSHAALFKTLSVWDSKCLQAGQPKHGVIEWDVSTFCLAVRKHKGCGMKHCLHE